MNKNENIINITKLFFSIFFLKIDSNDKNNINKPII